MAVTDIASRTYNHGWRLDPIVRSLLDTDFYKLLMLQMIREFYPNQQVTFSVINRSRHVRLAEVIDEGELRAQLDHARTIRFTKKELIWLAGNTFYGKTQMFSPDFINWLATSSCPNTSSARSTASTSCISTARGRTPRCGRFRRSPSSTSCARAQAMKGQGPLRARRALCPRQGQALDQGRAAAQARRTCDSPISARGGATVSCGSAGASRRVKEGLGPSFTGTSNVLLAMDNDLEAIGTNAHELPMVAAALAE